MPYTPLVFDAAPAQLVPAKDSALAAIRARIYSGEFQPGVKLSIDSLATEPGVSRIPIRGCLRATGARGAGHHYLARWCVRPPPYPFKAEDIARMKEAIEPLMARWAAERPSAVQRAGYRGALSGPAAGYRGQI